MQRTNNRITIAAVSTVCIVGLVAAKGHLHIRQIAKDYYHQYKDAAVAKAAAAEIPMERADSSMVIYDDKLEGGWQDWSWAGRSLTDITHVWRGNDAIRLHVDNWKGLYLHHSPFGVTGYGDLEVYVYGDPEVTVAAADQGGNFPTKQKLSKYYKSASQDGWKIARVPLEDIGAPKGSTITGFVFQADGPQDQGQLYLDQLTLTPDMSLPPPPTSATVPVAIDLDAGRHPISPYIYGMAFAPPATVKDLRLTVNRWGGNSTTRYNWALGNATSAARDWKWANRKAVDNVPDPGPSSAVDQFVAQNKSAGAQSVVTIPTIGWVAKDDNNATTSQHVPGDGGAQISGPDGPIAGYDPTANRDRTCVISAARKGAPFSDRPSGNVVYQDEWVHHLVTTFGTASDNGIKFYSMDNEPDIWHYTHTDIHPARMGYDDMYANFIQYASAVKAVDPSSMITGPVLSGWTGYLYSALDKGNDNYHTYADRKAHGNVPFLLWFLKKVHAHDQQTGRRTLDVVDIHYYPQASGVFSGTSDPDTNERRIRTTRSLWDPTYKDESWIGDDVKLVPRMQEWIDQGYPGTKLGITEWSFGGERSMSGAIADADALGIFGRDGVYLADYWAYPPENSPVYLAFKLYRNVDDNDHGFGTVSVAATSADTNDLAAYAAVDPSTRTTTVMLINKMRKATVTAPLSIHGLTGGHTLRVWRLSDDAPGKIVSLPNRSISTSNVTMTLPPYSVTLVSIGGAQ